MKVLKLRLHCTMALENPTTCGVFQLKSINSIRTENNSYLLKFVWLKFKKEIEKEIHLIPRLLLDPGWGSWGSILKVCIKSSYHSDLTKNTDSRLSQWLKCRACSQNLLLDKFLCIKIKINFLNINYKILNLQ